MNKYVIISTFCDKEDVANKIINSLLEKRLVAGSQVSKVHSKYSWNERIEECDEFKLQFRTKLSLFTEIENEIKKVHDYETAEISCTEIIDGSKEIFKWIEDNTK